MTGLSLVEMMVSLTIGLFLIAGAMAVFMAATATGARKQELDSGLEGFRFGSYTLSRVVRQASSINSTSTATSLSVTLPLSVENCLGTTTTTATETNVFDVSGGSLRCSVSGATAQALVEGIHSVNFTYGCDTSNTGSLKRVAASEYVASTNLTTAAQWARVSSVRVALTLRRSDGNAGFQESFVMTLRKKIFDIAQGTLTGSC